jgi:hypothetical protein
VSPKNAAQTLDLRTVTVAQLIEGLARGEPWCWMLAKRIVAAAARISSGRWRAVNVPEAGPREAV